jgi:hypothetical protein
VGAQADRIAEGERPAQQGLARPEREPLEVVALHPQQVEDVVEDRDPGCARLVRIAELHASLEAREARLALLEGHDLPVHEERVRVLRRERLGDLGVAVVQGLPVAREELHRLAAPDGEASFAVELPLEDPVGVGEALVRERGQHRLNPSRPLASANPAPELVGKRVDDRRGHRADASATSPTVRPEITDSGWVLVGRRRASAPSSSVFTSSQRASSPEPVRVKA